MDGIEPSHLDQHSSTSTSAPHPSHTAAGAADTAEPSSGAQRSTRTSRAKSKLAPASTVAVPDTTTSEPGPSTQAPRPRRSARISLATVPLEAESNRKAESETAAGKRKRGATTSLPTGSASTSVAETSIDRKGKKKESPPSSPLSDISEPLTDLPSESEEPLPPVKRPRGSAAARSTAEVEAQVSSSKAKGKGKAPARKAKAKMPRKTSAKRGGQSGLPTERNKKGDQTPKQLIDNDMEGDDSQWVDERAGPSRSRLVDDEDDDMVGSHHDEDDDDEDEDNSDNDEAPPPPIGGGSRSAAYERLARLAGESGMHLDEATAMALFGGEFRNFGGMPGGTSSRFKRLKNNLRSKNIATRLSALRECSELLLVSNEDTLGGSFSITNFATEFIAILKGQPNIDEDGEDAGPSNIEEMDEDAQLAAALAMSTGGAMPGGFGGDNEEEMECQLVACRCLAHLMEALPGTGHTLVHLGAVPALCSKLNEIAYIELAEQTLSTMEKISAEYPAAIVREGGLSALLNHLPFFSTNVQRTALTAAANCCRDISSEHYAKVKEVFPILRDTLTQADQRLVEQATLAVVRTMEAYRHNTAHLEGLLDLPTVVAINSLLLPSGGSPLVSPATYTHLLRTLTSSARCSATVTIAFLEAGMTNTVYQILTGVLPPSDNGAEQGESAGGQGLAGGVADMAVLQNLAHRPKDQVEETLALICELLPPTSRDGVFDSKAYTERSLARMKRKSDKPDKPEKPRRSSRTTEKEAAKASDIPAAVSSSDLPALVPTVNSSILPQGMSQANRDAILKQKKDAEAQVEQRLALLQGHPELIGRFIQSIVPVLVDVYAASVTARVRTKVLTGLVKAVAFGGPEELRITLKSVPMASFLGAIISSKDNPFFVLSALQLVELLVVKLKDIYQTSFMREGVVFEIEALAKQEPNSTKAAREKEELAAVKTEPGESSPAPVAGPSSGAGPSVQHILDEFKPMFAAAGLSNSFSSILAETAAGTGLYSSTPSKHVVVNPTDINIFRARVIVAKKLFEVGGDHHSAAVEVLEKLADQVKSIRAPGATDGELRDALNDIAAHFASVDKSLSSFELLNSGLIDGLLDYVEVDGTVKGDDRRSLLYEVFSDTNISSPSPLVMLVRRLHESLGRLENFEVETAFNGVSDSSRQSAYNLGRTIRIRLQAEEGQDVPKQVNALSVTIQAIAPMQALHDFLRPRIADGNYMAHSAASLFGAGGFGAGMAIPGGGGGRLSAFGGASRLLSALGGGVAGSGSAPLGGAPIASSAPESSGRMQPPAPEAKPDGPPQRRRSARLSAAQPIPGTAGEGSTPQAEQVEEAVAPAPAAVQGLSSSAPEASMFPGMPMDMDFDDDYSEEYEEEVYDEEMEEEMARPAEKVVNMSVAPDGSRVEVKTPDGTRVATPLQGASTSQAGPSTATGAVTPRSASYAGAVKAAPVDWHLEFSLNGKPISMEDTIYGAVHKSKSGATTLMGGVHGAAVVLKFKKVDGPAITAVDAPSPPSAGVNLPSAFEPDAPTSKILRLLRVLHNLTMDELAIRDDTKVERSLFVNNKLTAKLGRQLEETMIIASNCLPEWAIELPKYFSFLFPFETRYSFLQATSFGYGRLIARYQAAQTARSSNNNNHRRDDLSHLSRIVRQKVRISRTQLLESAAKVLELYGTSSGILEVEYFDEIGTGLGPTLEFYSLASKEFARRSLKLWRDEDDTKPGAYVFHPKGLYPAPAGANEEPASTAGSRLSWYKTIGLFAGRALLDSRIIDINLNKVFLRLILGQPVKKNIASLRLVDPTLARSLERLQAYAEARKEIEAMQLPASTKRNKLMGLSVNGASLQDLSLDFTLPGYDIELKSGGATIDVDNSNLDEYLDLVLEQTLGNGVQQQAAAFREGFSMIFSIKDMRIFAPEELGLLIGNADEDWSRETIEHAIKADHGYTLESRAVQNLVEVMAGYDKEERRQFLQFITGAPKLPIGGFRGLTPPFTVVRKPHEAPFRADDYLPSVMTCAQYLKMPDYSTKEALDQQLRRAIMDGGGSFHLS